MKKHFIILTIMLSSVFLTGCESQFKGMLVPINAGFALTVNNLQDKIKGLAKDLDDWRKGPDIFDSIYGGMTLMTDVSNLQETIFKNPDFLSLTPITPTITSTIPISYYASAPQPIRATSYAMDQLDPGAGQSMTALGMVSWLALAISLPFSMMRSLTATTEYMGPLGFLLSWVTIAGLWFMTVLTLDFMVTLVRNAGGLVKLLASIVGLFK